MGRDKRSNENCGQKDLRGPATIAEGEVIGDDGDQAFAWTVNYASGDHPGRIAPEAHHHAERLFSMPTGSLEKLIQVEGHAREVTKVLQSCEEREENCHGRQHHADYPRCGEVHSIDKHAR